jgi:hypothetical protein
MSRGPSEDNVGSKGGFYHNNCVTAGESNGNALVPNTMSVLRQKDCDTHVHEAGDNEIVSTIVFITSHDHREQFLFYVLAVLKIVVANMQVRIVMWTTSLYRNLGHLQPNHTRS